MSNGTTSWPTETPSSSDVSTAFAVLLTPFAVIPLCIIFARLLKYLYRRQQAKKFGYRDDIFQDPLAELGLKIKRGYQNTAEIRKIHLEQKRLQADIQKQADMDQFTIIDPSQQPTDFIGRQFQAADHYMRDIRKQTKKTFASSLSPEAVRRWVSTSRWARVWLVFQVVITILAIGNYISLTYLVNRSQNNEPSSIKNLDVLYASFFLIDYSLSFYTAEDRLLFYANYASLIDLLSIVTPFVYVIVTNPSKYVWFIGLIRIFRATRILRTWRLLSFSQSEETRELVSFILNFANFIFFAASLINAIETLVVDFNVPPSLLNWHDSLYYIMVTFSTIGFGDLTPSSTLSRAVVMILIILVIVYVPYQTGRILELYNSLSKSQRAKYITNPETGHVIVSGNVTYNGIIDFCREYFVADAIGNVVILHTEEPNIEMKRLLSHPFYRNRLNYIRADTMSVVDMRRAAAQYAMGIFLLNCQLTKDAQVTVTEEEELKLTREVDAQILMQSLSAKNSFPGVPIFAQVQDSRSAELADHCGCDRVICVDEIKMSLMATNCHVPGIQTMILNLIHSYEDMEHESFNDFWMKEYQCGASNQVISFRVPLGLTGIRYADAVTELYDKYGMTLFALQSSNSGLIQNVLRVPVDPDYRLKADDIAFGISDGKDELALRIAIRYKEKQNAMAQDLETQELEKEFGGASRPPVTEIIKSNPFGEIKSNFVVDEEVSFGLESGNVIPLGSVPPNIENHIILCGHISSRPIRHFVYTLRHRAVFSVTDKEPKPIKTDTPIVILMEHLPSGDDLGVWDDILAYPNVYIVRGSAIKKTSLERAHIQSCQRIIILGKRNSESDSISSMQDANAVFVVKLIQTEWSQVKFIVELVDGSNVKYFSGKLLEWNTENLRTKAILNNYTLGINDRLAVYRKLRAEGSEKDTIVYQLVQLIFGTEEKTQKQKRRQSRAQPKPYIDENAERANGNYDAVADLNPKEEEVETEKQEEGQTGLLTEAYLQRLLDQAELNESGLSPYPVYHYDRHFAAGMIATSSFIDSLLCQSYFRPYVVDVVKAMISNVVQLVVSPLHGGLKYIEVFHIYVQAGYVPIGLLRNGVKSASPVTRNPYENDDPTKVLPYVYTNCRPGDIVNTNDLVFAINRFEKH